MPLWEQNAQAGCCRRFKSRLPLSSPRDEAFSFATERTEATALRCPQGAARRTQREEGTQSRRATEVQGEEGTSGRRLLAGDSGCIMRVCEAKPCQSWDDKLRAAALQQVRSLAEVDIESHLEEQRRAYEESKAQRDGE